MFEKLLAICRGGGAKRQHLKTLFKLFPDFSLWKTYIEGFIFTFGVGLNLPIYHLPFRQRKIINVNDIDTRIIDLAHLYLFHPEKLYKAQARCIKVQGLIKQLDSGNFPQNTVWGRGISKWYLLHSVFSAKQTGTSMGYRINEYRSHYPLKSPNYFKQINDRLREMAIFNQDFRLFMNRFTNGRVRKGFAYSDPPYVSAQHAGIYEHVFTEKDHLDLGEIHQNLTKNGCLVAISYDKHTLIDEIYADWNFHEVSIKYSMAGCDEEGRRQGGRQIEYLITNYKPQKQEELPKWLKQQFD